MIEHTGEAKSGLFTLDARYVKILDCKAYRFQSLCFEFKLIYQMMNLIFLEMESSEKPTDSIEQVQKVISLSDSDWHRINRLIMQGENLSEHGYRVENIRELVNSHYQEAIEKIANYLKYSKSHFH